MSWANDRAVESPRYSVAEYRAKWALVKQRSAELDGPSRAERFKRCAIRDRAGARRILRGLTKVHAKGPALAAFSRNFWLRPKQLYPIRSAGTWRILLYLAGRGWGKTRAASEWIVERLLAGARVIVLVGPSEGDINEFMLGGANKRLDTGTGSGLFDVLPPPELGFRYEHNKEEGKITFPDFGAVVYLHSAHLPEYRGPQPDTIWGDELLKWRYPEKLLSNLRLACRAVGKVRPAIFLTSSPKRLKFLRDLVMDPAIVTIWGATDENRGNVDEGWLHDEHARLDGTRQGAEELGGELGIEDDGDLFKLSLIDELRAPKPPSLDRTVVAVDPSASETDRADECGIIVMGRLGDVHTGHGYVLDDLSDRLEWSKWGLVVVEAAIKHGASAIVAEKDKYGGSVLSNIKQMAATLGWETAPRPGFKTLTDLMHPKTGKRIQLIGVMCKDDKYGRACTLATLYESKRMHHDGHFDALETEQSECQANRPKGSKSPNRLDAAVHGATELFELDRPPQHDGKRMMQGFTAAHAKLNAPASGGGRTWVSAGSGRRDTI